jgi:hypothetical protein
VKSIGASCALLLLATFAIASPDIASEDAHRRQIAAVRVATPPELDGLLDDEAWELAEASGDFIRNHPDRGEASSQRTIVYVAYDDENLYVAADCLDTDLDGVIGTEMRRDYHVWEVNDYLRFVLDTFHDKRTAYYFGTNPIGVYIDARVTDNGAGFHSSWDAVWECAAVKHAGGWSAEFAIPFRQLRYPGDEEQVWGFNIGRRIRRVGEDSAWSSIVSDNVSTLADAGLLVGLRDLPRSRRVELRPSFGAGVDATYGDVIEYDGLAKPSLDVKYGVTSGLTLDATVNTDFAQIEADDENVNLSRFDLFFEEKRPFFLEGVGIFDMPAPLLYTRRIGSAGGRETPILAGMKLTGKAGGQSIGVLSVQTDDVDEIPETNFSALRVKRDLFQSSSAGFLLLGKTPSGGSSNQTAAVDFRYNPTREAKISGAVAQTWTEGPGGDDLGVTVDGIWSGEHTFAGGYFSDTGPEFNAEMGFITRTGIRDGGAFATHSVRLHDPTFRSIALHTGYNLTGDRDGQVLDRSANARLELEFESGDSTNVWTNRDWTFLEEPWEIREGIVIPAGMHTWRTYGFHVGTDERRKVRFMTISETSGFFGGTRRSVNARGHIRPTPSLLITADYDYNSVDLPAGAFHTNAVNGRAIYTFSPDMFVKLFLQWNDDSDRVRANALLRYTYQPGSDLYIVYKELWQAGEVRDRAVIGKLVYFLNL